MKFEISPEQAEVLKTCMSKHTAANKTLDVAMQRHSAVMEEITVVSDEMWKTFGDEFELDFSLDWAFTEVDGKAFIVSQNNPPAKTDDRA